MPTVLIADDDADHRELLTYTLRRLGYEVVAVCGAAGAERAIEAGGIDAILLDVRMPGGSGIALCRRLRAAPGTEHLPIMLVSADVGGDRIRAGLDAGADDFLPKPYRQAELGARLEALLEARQRPAGGAAAAATAAMRAARAALTRPVSVRIGPALHRTA